MNPLHTGVKAILAIVALGVIAWLGYPYYESFVRTDDPIDQTERMLVVFGTSGGDRDYNLRVENRVLVDGSVDVVFSVAAPKTKYGNDYNGFEVDVTVAFVGDMAGGIRCGTSDKALAASRVRDLPPGMQAAVRYDAAGGAGSAINFRGDRGLGFAEKAPDLVAYQHEAALQLLDVEDRRYRRESNDYLWAEACHLPAKTVWRSATDGNPLLAPRRTLLLPQFNFTSAADRTDHQHELSVRSVIERDASMVLVESYPLMAIDSSVWSWDARTSWNGKVGEENNIGYTDMSMAVFDARGSADRKAMYLTMAGAVMGVMGALLVYVLSRLVDLALWQYRRGDQ